MLRPHLGLKVVALLLSIVLWLYVTIEVKNPQTERTFTAVAQPEFLAQGMRITSPLPKIVVRVQGPRRNIADLQPDQMRPTVNLSGLRAGRHVVQIGTSVPDPLTVETSPREVTVVVERILQRTVPVEVIWDPPKEGVTRHPFAQPDRVRVTGVQSAVERVVRVVARFDRTGPDLQMVGLKPVDANGKVVTGVVCSPSQVTVSVGLPPTRASFSAPVSVQTTGRLPDGYELGSVQATPREVTIVAAEEAVLREVRAISTAPVALNGITATTSRTVDLVLPSGVTAPGVATVTVLIEVRRTAAPEDPAAGGATPGG